MDTGRDLKKLLKSQSAVLPVLFYKHKRKSKNENKATIFTVECPGKEDAFITRRLDVYFKFLHKCRASMDLRT